MRSLLQLVVVAFTVVTLTLVAAVGVSAGSGKFGGSHGSDSVVALTSHFDLGSFHIGSSEKSTKGNDNKGEGDKGDKGKECKPPKKHHEHGTPGHKHHPCGETGDDTD